MNVRIGVLGPLRLDAGEGPVELGGRRSRAVLAVLAAHPGRAVPVDRLVALVWGEEPPGTVANQLQIAVHQVRRSLAAAGLDAHRVLRRDGGGYILDPGDAVTCDLNDFRRHAEAGTKAARDGDWTSAREEFQAAVAQWRGPAFAEVDAPGIAALAVGAEEERLVALEARMVADLVAGDAARVIADAAGALTADPLRERTRHLLILAHALDGDADRARAEYDEAHAAVADALGIDPGPDLRALATELAAPARALDRVREWVTGSAVVTVRPMGLPASTRHFVGREGELAALATALRGDTPAVVTIAGLGGVGKTALAVRAASDAMDAYPDGCLYIDLRGADPAPREAFGVLGTFLRSLGVPDDAVPDDMAQRREVYRRLLAGRRLLVVLDNALDAEQVRPLLPPDPGSAALVTGRRALGDLDGVELTLGSLAAGEAVDLLTRLAGAAADGLDEIAALAGRLPLALRILGARLARRRGLTVQRMSARLADEQYRLDVLADGDRQVRSCIEFGYERLSERAQAMLRAAAWLPVSEFSLAMLAGMLDMDPRAAQEPARELVEAQLLAVGRAKGRRPRYVIHDLVGVFTRQASAGRAEEREAVLLKGCVSLLAALLRADAALGHRHYPTPEAPAGLPGPGPLFAAAIDADPRGWFDDELELVVASAGLALGFGREDLAWRLATGVGNRIDLIHSTDGDERLWAMVGGLAESPDPRIRAALLSIRALMLRQRDRWAECRSLLRVLRRLYVRGGDRIGAAFAAVQLSVAARHLADDRTAAAAAAWAVSRLDGLGSPAAKAQRGWALIARANTLMSVEPATAHDLLEEAIADFRGAGDREGEANALAVLGVACQWLRRFPEAVARYAAAREIQQELGQLNGRLFTDIAMADCLITSGEFERAEQVVHEAIAEADSFGQRFTQVNARRLAGVIRRRMGDAAGALPHLERALALVGGMELVALRAQVHQNIAEAHLDLGELGEARRQAVEGLAFAGGNQARRRMLEKLVAAAEKAADQR